MPESPNLESNREVTSLPSLREPIPGSLPRGVKRFQEDAVWPVVRRSPLCYGLLLVAADGGWCLLEPHFLVANGFLTAAAAIGGLSASILGIDQIADVVKKRNALRKQSVDIFLTWVRERGIHVRPMDAKRMSRDITYELNTEAEENASRAISFKDAHGEQYVLVRRGTGEDEIRRAITNELVVAQRTKAPPRSPEEGLPLAEYASSQGLSYGEAYQEWRQGLLIGHQTQTGAIWIHRRRRVEDNFPSLAGDGHLGDQNTENKVVREIPVRLEAYQLRDYSAAMTLLGTLMATARTVEHQHVVERSQAILTEAKQVIASLQTVSQSEQEEGMAALNRAVTAVLADLTDVQEEINRATVTSANVLADYAASSRERRLGLSK